MTQPVSKHVAAVTAALCGAMTLTVSAFASGQHCEGFARIGDRFPDTAKAMNADELKLFHKVQELIEVQQRIDPADPWRTMQKASARSVLNVKINRAGDILVNLKPDTKPRQHPIGDDPFYAGLAAMLENHLAATQKREPRRMWSASPWPYNFCFVYGGQTAEPDEDIPMRWPAWFVPRYDLHPPDPPDFFRTNGVYRDAAKPMTPFERELFVDIRKILKRAHGAASSVDDFQLPPHPEKSLLGVKVGKHGDILVNMKADMPFESEGSDADYMFMLENSIDNLATRKLDIRPVTYLPGEKLPIIYVTLTREGRDTYPVHGP